MPHAPVLTVHCRRCAWWRWTSGILWHLTV